MEEPYPQKAFYTIGEVSRITGVKPHVLRYWESRGKLLKPNRRRSKHRLYRPQDIRLILEIKRLRDEEKLTLAAMRRQMRDAAERHPVPPPPPLSHPSENQALALLRTIQEELQTLRELLE